MTRKDYQLIAAALRSCKPVNPVPGADALTLAESRAEKALWLQIGNHLAVALASDNPAFDRARFLKACGL